MEAVFNKFNQHLEILFSCYQLRNGSSLSLMAGVFSSDSGYSVKFEVSPALFTTGIYVTGIFFSSKCFQLIASKNLWFLMSWAPGVKRRYWL